MASRKIEHLAFDLQILAIELVHVLHLQGIELLIYGTYRSAAEQDALYESGRTKPGNILTYLKGGQSKHNISIAGKPSALAFDAVPLRSGKPVWGTTGEDLQTWRQVGIEAVKLGLHWGGDWKGPLKDFPHFEI